MSARKIPKPIAGILAMVAVATAMSAPAHALEQYTAGHADLAAYNSGTTLQLRYHFAATATVDGQPVGGTGRVADPALIETIVPNSSTLFIPDDPTFSPYWRGRNTWYIPPNNLSGVPFLGLGNEVSDGIFTGNLVSLHLDSIVSRPTGGEFMLVSGDGAPVYMDTANPESPNRVANMSHNHYYWAFSEVGTYQINFRAEATILATGLPTSTISTFTFTVVPEPSTWVLASAGVVVAGFAARRKTRNRP